MLLPNFLASASTISAIRSLGILKCFGFSESMALTKLAAVSAKFEYFVTNKFLASLKFLRLLAVSPTSLFTIEAQVIQCCEHSKLSL